MAIYDVIVVGLGAMGSSTLYQLSELKKLNTKLAVLGIDQYDPPHTFGSTYGETRIIREANFKKNIYVKIAKHSMAIFSTINQRVEKELGSLYNKAGGLLIAQEEQWEKKLKYSYESTIKHRIPHQLLDYKALTKNYPQFKLPPESKAIYEKNMGYIHPEKCIQAQLSLAKSNGVDFRLSTKITNFKHINNNLIQLMDDKGQQYISKKVIICAGPWVTTFLNRQSLKLFKLSRQVQYWFAIDPKFLKLYQPDTFPTFIWYFNEDEVVYGFPSLDKKTLKIAVEIPTDFTTTNQAITPESVDRQVSPVEMETMYNKYIEPNFTGITNQCVKASACLYTMAATSNFVIDFLPGFDDKIIIASPCSGYGFKYSAAIGESLAKISIDKKSRFSLIKEFGCIF